MATAQWECLVCGYIGDGDSPPRKCPVCGSPWTAFAPHQPRPEPPEGQSPHPAGYRYLIVGNSAAGRSAASAIRRQHPEGRITVISEEDCPFYYRPILPDYIAGTSKKKVFDAGAEAYADEALVVHTNRRAVTVDPAAKEVACADGERIGYDALLLAVGSTPRIVEWPGCEADGIEYFRTWADAERLKGLLEEVEHAVVVGGGLLGLEFVRAFRALDLPVTHLIRDDRVGGPALDAQAAALIEKRLRDDGVEVALNEEVASFESAGGRVSAVLTSQGRRIECQLVGVAVGVVSRLELARSAGCEIDRGILVDEHMQTTVPGVYAAGDVAQAMDVSSGERRVNTSWRNSDHQGRYAGLNMAGVATPFPGSVRWSYQLAGGVPFVAIGLADPESEQGFEIERDLDESAGNYRKEVRRGGRLVGAVLLGDTSDAAALESAIAEEAR